MAKDIYKINKSKNLRYMRNVGRSLGYAFTETITAANPTISAMFSQAKEQTSNLYHGIKDFSSNIRNFNGNTNSPTKDIKETVEYGFNNLLSDLKSGNWYNKEREEQAVLSAMGMDDDTFNFDLDNDSFDFDFDDETDKELSANAKIQAQSTKKTIEAMDAVGAKTSAAIGAASVHSANYIVRASRANTNALFKLNTQGFSTVSSGIAAVNANIGTLVELGKPLTEHMQNSSLFFTKTTEYQEKTIKLLEQLVANTTSKSSNQSSSNHNKRLTLSDLYNSDGTINIDSIKQVVKNKASSSSLGFGLDMLGMFGNPKDMMKTLAANPLGLVLGSVFNRMLDTKGRINQNKSLKQAMGSFNDTLAGFLPNLLAKFKATDFSKNEKLPNWLKSLLTEVKFSLPSSGLKQKLDTGNYEKGKVDWDGISRKTLVEVIPTQLGKILAALTGEDEQIYDYKTGKFTPVKKLHRKYQDRLNTYANNAVGSLFGDTRKMIKKSSLNKKDKKSYDAQVQAFINQLFLNDNEDYYKFVANGDFNYSRYKNQISETTLKDFRRRIQAMAKSDPSYLNTYAKNMNSNRKSYGQEISNPDNNYASLHNKSAKINATSIGNNLLINTTDENNKNIFFYLQGIYQNTAFVMDNFTHLIPHAIIGNEGATGPQTVNLAPVRSLAPSINSHQSKAPGNYKSYNEDHISINQSAEDMVSSRNPNNNLDKYSPEKWFTKEQRDYMKKKEQGGTNFVVNDDMEEQIRIINNNIKKAKERDEKRRERTGKLAENKVIKNFMDLSGVTTDAFINMIEGANDKMNDFIFGTGGSESKSFASIMSDSVSGIFGQFTKTMSSLFPGFVKDWLKGINEALGITDKLKAITKNSFQGIIDWFTGVNSSIMPHDEESEDEGESGSEDDTGSNDEGGSGSGIKNFYKKANAAFNSRKAQNMRGWNKTSAYKNDIIPINTIGAGRSTRIKSRNRRRRFGIGGGKTNTSSDDAAAGAADDIANDQNISGEIKGGIIHRVANFIINKIEGNTYSEDATEEQKEKVHDDRKRVANAVDKLFRDATNNKNAIGAGALMGAGVSLLTGVALGPIAGAAIGAGLGFISKSETAQNFLFGYDTEEKDKETGEMKKVHKEGKIEKLSPKLSKFLQEQAPDVFKGGTVGAVVGTITGSPVLGAIIGSSIGFVKSSNWAKNKLFGEIGEDGQRKGGIISKKVQELIKQKVPAMGVGAAAGLLVGPFGILGNILVGSAVGMVADTEDFKDWLFGKKDPKTGKRKLGVGGFSEYMKKTLFNPIISIFKNFGSEIADTIKDSAHSVTKSIRQFLIKKFFIPLFNTGPFKKLFGKVRGVGKKVYDFATSPIRGLANVGTRMRINRGKVAYDPTTGKALTAEERNQFRKNHNMFNLGFNSNFDQYLSDIAQDEDLDAQKQKIGEIRNFLTAAIDPAKNSEEELAKSKFKARDAFEKFIKENFADPNSKEANKFRNIYNKEIGSGYIDSGTVDRLFSLEGHEGFGGIGNLGGHQGKLSKILYRSGIKDIDKAEADMKNLYNIIKDLEEKSGQIRIDEYNTVEARQRLLNDLPENNRIKQFFLNKDISKLSDNDFRHALELLDVEDARIAGLDKLNPGEKVLSDLSKQEVDELKNIGKLLADINVAINEAINRGLISDQRNSIDQLKRELSDLKSSKNKNDKETKDKIKELHNKISEEESKLDEMMYTSDIRELNEKRLSHLNGKSLEEQNAINELVNKSQVEEEEKIKAESSYNTSNVIDEKINSGDFTPTQINKNEETNKEEAWDNLLGIFNSGGRSGIRRRRRRRIGAGTSGLTKYWKLFGLGAGDDGLEITDNPDIDSSGEDETVRDQYGNEQINQGSTAAKEKVKKQNSILAGFDSMTESSGTLTKILNKMESFIDKVGGIDANGKSTGLFGSLLDSLTGKAGIAAAIISFLGGGKIPGLIGAALGGIKSFGSMLSGVIGTGVSLALTTAVATGKFDSLFSNFKLAGRSNEQKSVDSNASWTGMEAKDADGNYLPVAMDENGNPVTDDYGNYVSTNGVPLDRETSRRNESTPTDSLSHRFFSKVKRQVVTDVLGHTNSFSRLVAKGSQGLMKKIPIVGKGVGKVPGLAKLMSKLTSSLNKIIGWISKQSWASKLSGGLEKLKKLLIKSTEEAAEQSPKKVAKATAKSALKIIGAVLTVAFMAWDFQEGYAHAAQTWEVMEPTGTQKILSGIIHMLLNLCPVISIFVPDKVVIGIVEQTLYPLLAKEEYESLGNERAAAKYELDQYNAEHGTNLTWEEFCAKNGNLSLGDNIRNFAKDQWDKFKRSTSDKWQLAKIGWNKLTGNSERVDELVQEYEEQQANRVTAAGASGLRFGIGGGVSESTSNITSLIAKNIDSLQDIRTAAQNGSIGLEAGSLSVLTSIKNSLMNIESAVAANVAINGGGDVIQSTKSKTNTTFMATVKNYASRAAEAIKKGATGGSIIWNAIVEGLKNLIPGLKSDSDNEEESTAAGASGMISQLDPRYSGMSMGGRSVRDMGCGPASAVNALNALGKSTSMSSAVNLASNYQTTGGTDLSYFADEFSRNGVNSSYVTGSSMLNAVASGTPTVLMGRDPGNTSKSRSPFGPNNHYVVANGIDRNGNINISDPESRGVRKYSPSILGSVSAGVAASGSGISKRFNRFTRRNYNKNYRRFGLGAGAANIADAELEQRANIQNIKRVVWTYLVTEGGMEPFAAAGIMGNMDIESMGINPNSIESDYVNGRTTKYPDKNDIVKTSQSINDYTQNWVFTHKSVSEPNYLANDGYYYCGIGLIQWTGNRCKAFLDYAKENNCNWNDLKLQLNYLIKVEGQTKAYKKFYDGLNTIARGIRNDPSKADIEKVIEECTKYFAKGVIVTKSNIPGRISAANDYYWTFKDASLDIGYDNVGNVGIIPLTGENSEYVNSYNEYSNYNSPDYADSSTTPSITSFLDIISNVNSAFSDALNPILNWQSGDGTSSTNSNDYNHYIMNNTPSGKAGRSGNGSSETYNWSNVAKINDFPYYSQNNPQWADTPYTIKNDPDQTISKSGCGPTSMSMVLRSFGKNVNPPIAAKWSLDNGHRTADVGTDWEYFTQYPQVFGLTGTRLPDNNTYAIKEALSNGYPVISSQSKGNFTKKGHFIVLSGYDPNTDTIYVNDPNSETKSHGWSSNEVLSTSKAAWSFNKDGYGSIGQGAAGSGLLFKGSSAGNRILLDNSGRFNIAGGESDLLNISNSSNNKLLTPNNQLTYVSNNRSSSSNNDLGMTKQTAMMLKIIIQLVTSLVDNTSKIGSIYDVVSEFCKNSNNAELQNIGAKLNKGGYSPRPTNDQKTLDSLNDLRNMVDSILLA